MFQSLSHQHCLLLFCKAASFNLLPDFLMTVVASRIELDAARISAGPGLPAPNYRMLAGASGSTRSGTSSEPRERFDRWKSVRSKVSRLWLPLLPVVQSLMTLATPLPCHSRVRGGRTRTLVVPNHACSHLHLDSNDEQALGGRLEAAGFRPVTCSLQPAVCLSTSRGSRTLHLRIESPLSCH